MGITAGKKNDRKIKYALGNIDRDAARAIWLPDAIWLHDTKLSKQEITELLARIVGAGTGIMTGIATAAVVGTGAVAPIVIASAASGIFGHRLVKYASAMILKNERQKDASWR